jgi:peptide/nickel transport system substrate-binding protein
LALLAVMCSIMQKRQWEGQELADAKIADIPLGCGPYVITKYDAGRSVQLTRNKMYWGSDTNLPLHRGTNNFDQITLDFCGESTAQYDAFKAGQVSAQREFNVKRWNSRYDVPLALAGDVV